MDSNPKHLETMSNMYNKHIYVYIYNCIYVYIQTYAHAPCIHE